jgi:hypothetical protein
MGAVQLIERPLDVYRNSSGAKRTAYWRENKEVVIAQGQAEEQRARKGKSAKRK